MNTPMIAMPGGGGVGIGTNSPFGDRFGEYATRLRDQIARNWRTSEIDARIQSAPPATVVFTIRRDGSLAPNSVRILESSGNKALDFSAQRAVLDSERLPPLPAQYSGSEATVELRFFLRR
jgi:protein TonB